MTLSGSLASGDTYVISHSSAASAIQNVSDLNSTVTNFNGDDFIVLYKGSNVLDSIGTYGYDPGSCYGSGSVITKDKTLIRLASVTAGDTNINDTIDPSATWTALSNNDFSNLGSHTADGGGTTPPDPDPDPNPDLGTYYQSVQGLTGSALKTQLNNIIDGHTEFSYSAAYNALIVLDRDPNNANNVILLYSGRSENGPAKYNSGQGWNREHVWAKSHGDFGTTMGAGTDLHMLRATDVNVNSTRNNYDFDNVPGGRLVNETTDCYVDSTNRIFESRDEVKGDVARILFYMAVRYEADDQLDLELSENRYSVGETGSGYGEHGVLSVLKAWHIADPVDAGERTRNDLVYTDYQGNRNPFVDHPEFLQMIWGN